MSTQKEMMAAKGYVPVSEVAEKLGVHVTSIYRLMDADSVDGIRVGRSRYVSKVSLAKYYRQIDPKAADLLGL